jgi:hypothetical protein
LTVSEIARLDKCYEKTVRRAIDGGLLEVLRIGPGGRSIRIPVIARRDGTPSQQAVQTD